MPSPTTSSSTSNVGQTTSLNINALISGEKWGGATGTGVTVSYSFPWTSSSSATFSGHNGIGDYSSLNEQNATYHYGLNTTQQAAARSALQSWANVANITFSEVAETSSNVGDIRFAWTSATDLTSTGERALGVAYHPDSYWPDGGDVWISTLSAGVTNSDWSVGSYNFAALTHELGHALGLKHPFEDTPVLPSALDNRLYTVMSYTDAPHNIYPCAGYVNGVYSWITYRINPETPMVLDIAAMQYLHGANTSYHTGNDTYTFDNTQPFFETIWDAGGTDTLSVSNFTLSCVIDLTPGHYSSLRIPPPSGNTGGATTTYDGTDNLGIAYGCVIENAIGSSGNDSLIGNDANNSLSGGPGNDSIDGSVGVDTALYSASLVNYTLTKNGSTYTVHTNSGSDGTDTLTNIESVKFTDMTVNLTVQAKAAVAPLSDVNHLTELYVAFFNRVPDADGLAYWIDQMNAGQSLNQIAESFYSAGVTYAGLTGFSAGMSDQAFINVFYKNVLGRAGGADAGGLAYWNGQLANGSSTRSSLGLDIVYAAHLQG